jgi:hypothetical protein
MNFHDHILLSFTCRWLYVIHGDQNLLAKWNHRGNFKNLEIKHDPGQFEGNHCTEFINQKKQRRQGTKKLSMLSSNDELEGKMAINPFTGQSY